MAKKKKEAPVSEYKLIMRLDTPSRMTEIQRAALKEVVVGYVEQLAEIQFDDLPALPEVTVVYTKLLNLNDEAQR